MDQRVTIAIVGAGIAGVAAARYLSHSRSFGTTVLIDSGPVMGFTTSCSGENFRAYWPRNSMAALAEDSICEMLDLQRQTQNAFAVQHGGYNFVSQHTGSELFGAVPPEVDHRRITDPQTLRREYPYLSDQTREVLRILNAGSVDVHGLGQSLLSAARQDGVTVRTDLVRTICPAPGGYVLHMGSGEALHASRVVICAGPMTPRLLEPLAIRLPIEAVLQHKFVMPDPLVVVPRDMPFTILADEVVLDWNDEERALIDSDDTYQWLLQAFPPGLHIKPETGGRIKLGWAYNRTVTEPVWNPQPDPEFPSVVLRGAARMIPGLGQYRDKPPVPLVQFSGYYSRTPENLPLIGPLPGFDGLYTISALSGFGTMVACAAAKLLADWICENDLPAYAKDFDPGRYEHPRCPAEGSRDPNDGQL